ncbi:MAG: hypothetical protein KBB84_08300 [Spirochaetes bacterium]|jgi:hypothetical protein|nr:hypothetical protein [Spirochaetota bacterium]
MNKRIGLVSILALFLLTSCVTTNQVEYGKENASHTPIEFENEDLKATLSFESSQWINLSIENKKEDVVQFVTDLATFSSVSGNTSKLVPDGTKYIDVKNTVPSSAIAPKSNFQKSFFSADSVYYQSGEYGGWRTRNWIPDSLIGSTFIFTYKINGNDKYIIFKGDDSVSSLPAKATSFGSVTVNKTYWHVLFLKSADSCRESLYEAAMTEAKKQYGENIVLKNLKYKGNWSPASLLLYFSMLGYVEKASLTADVYPLN